MRKRFLFFHRCLRLRCWLCVCIKYRCDRFVFGFSFWFVSSVLLECTFTYIWTLVHFLSLSFEMISCSYGDPMCLSNILLPHCKSGTICSYYNTNVTFLPNKRCFRPIRLLLYFLYFNACMHYASSLQNRSNNQTNVINQSLVIISVIEIRSTVSIPSRTLMYCK